jgi:hypothetical protein
MCEPWKPRNVSPRETELRDHWECRTADLSVKAMSTSLLWNLSTFELPGVAGDGMSGRNGQRKPGTARGWPRRSRTAEASHISRRAVKLRCARERGGWGRVSDDGSRQHNSIRSEDPWGRWSIPPHGGAVIASTDPTLGGSTLKHEGRRQTSRRSVYAGSWLKLIACREGLV